VFLSPRNTRLGGFVARFMRCNYARKVMVEGKGFVYLHALNIRYFVAITLQNAANCCATCAGALTADPDFWLLGRPGTLTAWRSMSIRTVAHTPKGGSGALQFPLIGFMSPFQINTGTNAPQTTPRKLALLTSSP
jgi:hypothetical protein